MTRPEEANLPPRLPWKRGTSRSSPPPLWRSAITAGEAKVPSTHSICHPKR
jgi:hypothetical protein